MIDLKARPYYLSDEDIAWVKDTISAMSDEEKVGQLFFQLTAGMDENYLKDLVGRYHLGGCRYNNMPAMAVQMQNRILQTNSKIPLIIACNTENGGSGAASDGTYIASGIKIGATDNLEYARALGRCSNEEAASFGCNMAFAPVCDIHLNWQNTEVVSRAFGSDPDRVANMSRAYLEGAHTVEGFACAAKHFPGNGLDFRDAHVANNVNGMTEEEWMATYGKVYKTLIEADLDAVMGGHIMMPEYMRAQKPGITDEEMLPATLCPEIMTGLLRDKLGFNGMVVTDASHMVAMTDRMTRREMLPAAINAGCDMFLFFNDPDEDFATMLDAYKSGVISEQRMTEALTRILGLKAHMGLNKKAKEQLVPTSPASEVVGREEYKAISDAISRDALTLVKYKDKDVLPLTPEKYKRVMIVYVKGAAGPMDALISLAMGGGAAKKNPAEELRDRLIERGFDAFIYESPIEKIKQQIAKGEKPSLNIYFAGKNSIEDFKSEQDLVITLFDVMNGRPSFGMSKGGGEIPWYVFELPVVGISVNVPTMLADVPQLRTYINAYDSKPSTLDHLVDALTKGADAFGGKDPIDSFCGLFDARI
ncbi:MAG: beta-hexosaminidase [Clostridia bacterium]|nr:beta-hexosaminidase [Clostridia bacterium]